MSPVSPRVWNVGRYRVHDVLGIGGMASVHLARITGAAGFSRVVAIKRLHEALARDPEQSATLIDEARLASRVRHPNVVAVLELVEEAGELFLVMEYVEGEALSRMRGEAVPVGVAVAIACDVLEGLHAAHEARGASGEPLELVHRDVSPQNILVGTDGLAHLLDFGIAKARGRVQVTKDGGVKGKIGYMAPEHLRGEPLSRAADIYATAAVLWEMLAGRRLFDGDNEAAVVVASLNGVSDPPSRHAREVPAALDAVVMRGLARHPASRFATARAMADALRNVATPAAPSAVAGWVETRAKKAIETRREVVAAIESGSDDAGRTPDPATLAEPATVTVKDRRRLPVAWSIAAGVVIACASLVAVVRASPAAFTLTPKSPRTVDIAPAPNLTQNGGFPPPAPPPTGELRSPLSRPPTPAPGPAPAPARPRPTAKPDCNPPYTLDGHRKVFKPGCL